MSAETITSITSIIIAITSIIMTIGTIIGICISYKKMKKDFNKQFNDTNTIIASIINSQTQNNGNVYTGCIFNASVEDQKSISNNYENGQPKQ
jgi:uncharacterized membrane protein